MTLTIGGEYVDIVATIYKNIDKMTDKNFNEYKKTISKELAKEFRKDLFDNNGLDRFMDIKKTMRCMQIADIGEK